MVKIKNYKTSLLIGIVLLVILAIILASLIYVFFCVDVLNSHRDTVITYDRLQSVTTDSMLYLSSDFMYDNYLKILPVDPLYFDDYKNSTFPIGDVILECDTYKVSTAFNKRNKKVDLYRYEMISSESDGIPVRVSVVGAVGVNKKLKYDLELGNGDKYVIIDNMLTTYFNGIGKSYEIKGKVGKSGAIDKYSRIKITVTVDATIKNNYSLEDIEKRVDEVLNSSLNYVVRYSTQN